MKCCKDEVYWSPVQDYKQFLHEISVLTFTKILYGTQIPTHCNEGFHHQQHIQIIFEPSVSGERAQYILDQIGLNWNSLSSDYGQSSADGGTVFTRPNHSGYWILKAPCLKCYTSILDSGRDISKSCLLSFI